MSLSYVEIIDLLFIFFVVIGLYTLRKDVDRMGFEVDELRREMGEMEVVVVRIVEEVHALKELLAKATMDTDWSGVVEVTARLDAAEKMLDSLFPKAEPPPVVPYVPPPTE